MYYNKIMSLINQQNFQTNFEINSHILRIFNQCTRPKCEYHDHLLYKLDHAHLIDLINPKKWLGHKIVQNDLITPIFSPCIKGAIIETKITDKYKKFDAFNNIVFKFKIDNNTEEQIQIEKIFEWIDIRIGGQSFDKIYGTSIKALLNIYKLTYDIKDNVVSLPIPFGITSNDNVVVNKKIPWYECRVFFKIGTKYDIIKDSLEIMTKHYTSVDDPTKHFKKDSIACSVELLNLFEQSQSQIYKTIIDDNNKIKLLLYFDHPIFEMVFYFVDKEKNIATEKLFKSYHLLLDNVQANYDANYDFVKDMSSDLPDGFYKIDTKNLLLDQLNCDCEINKELARIINFSRINTSYLIIDPIDNFDSSKYEIVVMAINANFIIYNEDKYIFDTMYKN